MSNKDVIEHLLGYLELCPGYVIIFPSLSESFFFFNSNLNDSEMDLSTVPVKCQLPLVWHPSVNAIRANICSQKWLPDLCWFFLCLPGFSLPAPVIPADPQKSKDPYSCAIAASSAGFLKLRSSNWRNDTILFTRKRIFFSVGKVIALITHT